MSEGKKDVLEFPLEELSAPQAIAIMMQAANKAGKAWCDEQENAGWEPDDERLQLLIEKLEAYIEDLIDKAAIPVEVPVVEGAPDEEFEPADETDTFLQKNDQGDVLRVVHKGVVFGRLCNERVYTDPSGVLDPTTCVKEWGHANPIHEDEFGNER